MNPINSNRTSGFTIVELLVVIVVIGILASITIVSYNGIQNRARNTTNIANAQEVQTKAEIYASDTGNGVFPSNGTTFEAIPTTDNASLTPAVKTLLGTTVPAGTSDTTRSSLIYQQCGTDGARVGYWDYTVSGGSVVYLYSGNATSSTTCSAAG